MDDGGSVTQLSRDLSRLQAQVQSLRLALLRSAVAVCLALLLLGLVMSSGRDNLNGDPVTTRVLTSGFQAFAHAEGSGAVIALGIGFLGLLVVVLVLAGLLLQAVLVDDWHPNRGRVFLGVVGTLAVVGTAVAVLISAIGASSDLSNVSGGWGPVVLMVGVVLSIVVLASGSLRGRK